MAESGTAPAATVGNSCRRLVRHDYKRAVYRAMLSEFTPDEIKEYFGLFPLIIDGKEIRGTELFHLLWRKKASAPLSWEYGTDNLLERFLIEKGRDPARFMSRILWLNGKSTPIPGKVILSWCYPILESIFRSLDSKDMCLTWMCKVSESWIPGMLHRRIRKRETDGWVECAFVYITHPDHREYQDWDMEFIGGPQMIACPLMVGLSPFERFDMLADTRPVESIAWSAADGFRTTDGEFRIGDEKFGSRLPFLDFCRIRDLDVSSFASPNPEIIAVERDFYCPTRGRVVLHAGCAYGAPFFIHQIGYSRTEAASPGNLEILIKDFDREDSDDQEAKLDERHQTILESFRDTADFAYHSADDRLTLEGKAVVKGIQAKILRNVLNAYVRQGQTRFEYHEFKREFEISLGRKNANFEVRLYRLMEKLESIKAPIRIGKSGRGEFTLRTEADIRFQVVEGPPKA